MDDAKARLTRIGGADCRGRKETNVGQCGAVGLERVMCGTSLVNYSS